MPDPQHTPSRSLSEIGHLFLSSVRERHTSGATLPKRQPPPTPASGPAAATPMGPRLAVPEPPRIEATHIDLTSQSAPTDDAVAAEAPLNAAPEDQLPSADDDSAPAPAESRTPPVTAIIATHLNGRQLTRARDYARHLAASGQRIGLIEIDAADFRLTCFDTAPLATDDSPAATTQALDARAMTDAIEELGFDLDRWLLLVPNPRTPEAKALLRDAPHWVLLCTCDHDGVVSCYRTLKGLGDLCVSGPRPRLSLALLNARDAEEAGRTYRKLAGVCRQFLSWELDCEPAVARPSRAASVAEHLVLCGGNLTKSNSPQWQVVAAMLARARTQAAFGGLVEANADEPLNATAMESEPIAHHHAADPQPATAAAAPMPSIPFPTQHQEPRMTAAAAAAIDRDDDLIPTVIDIPCDADGGATGPIGSGAILSAILQSESSRLVECPAAVRPPMCPEARLAVTRDRRVVLLAAARAGLSDLRAIGRAYNWLTENKALICLAVPQLAIDPCAHPCLRLLVDHADLTADILQPMLHSSTVTVQAYRRLRWGGKMGLMLEAA
jgi:hypothetical protein